VATTNARKTRDSSSKGISKASSGNGGSFHLCFSLGSFRDTTEEGAIHQRTHFRLEKGKSGRGIPIAKNPIPPLPPSEPREKKGPDP